MTPLFFPAPEQLSLQLAWIACHEYAGGRVHFTPAVTVPFAWYLSEGALRVEIAEQSFEVAAGQWVWHPPCGARRLEAVGDGARWLSLGLSARCGESDWFAPTARHQFVVSSAQTERGRTLLEWLLQARDFESALERDGLARAFIGWLWRASGAQSRPPFPPWLEAALRLIESQPDVTVAQLAREAHFSPAQFRRLWERWMGASPRETLLQRRVELAQRALQTKDIGLDALARECGFGSVAALRRAFATRVGSSPSQWRQASRDEL